MKAWTVLAVSILCTCPALCQTDDGGPPIGTTYPAQGNFGQTFYGRQYVTPFGTISTPMGAPIPFVYGQSYYTIATPTATYRFWRAPSGYYYPWYHYPIGFVPPYGWAVPIYYTQGAMQPQRPTLSQVFQDLGNFLQQSQKEGKLQPNDFAQLTKRLNDLKSKVSSLKFEQGGTLSDSTEEDLRTDLDNFAKEASFRLR